MKNKTRQERQIYYRDYRRTVNGFLSNCYSNIMKRISGRHLMAQLKFNGRTRGANHYIGLPAMTREEFTTWTKQDNDFIRLFAQWERSNYDRRFTPSPDRVDILDGYVLGNIEWVTASQNSKNAHLYGRLRK